MTKTIKCNSLNEGYQLLIKELIANGTFSVGRQQGEIKELLNYELELTNPRKSVLSLPMRNMSRKYAAGEFALYLEETDDVKDFAFYSKAWLNLATKDGKVNSAYGERLFSEASGHRLDYAIDELVKNRESKNSLVMMRDVRDQNPELKDRCCTIALHFYIRGNKLNMRTIMRSSDIWLGLPYDVFAFTRIMQMALYRYNKCTGSNVELGTYFHQMLNVHAYPKNYAKLISYVEENGYLDLDTDKAYEFPEFTAYDEKELPKFLQWEQSYRKDTLFPNDVKAEQLRDMKLHPFFETLGSWLLNKITNDLPTARDGELFRMAEAEATKSTCIDRKVGCVITDRDGNVMGIGHNTVINCNQNCHDKLRRVCNVTHAEVCAINQIPEEQHVLARTAYVTLYPCLPCRLALNKAGIYDIRVKGFSHKGAGGDSLVHLYDPEYTK